MQVTELANDGLRREYKITIPADTIGSKVSTRLAEVAQTVALPGFRRGNDRHCGRCAASVGCRHERAVNVGWQANMYGAWQLGLGVALFVVSAGIGLLLLRRHQAGRVIETED